VIGPSQRPLPDGTQHSQKIDIYAACGIRTRYPSKWAVPDPRLRPRGHWDRPFTLSCHRILTLHCNTALHVTLSQYYPLTVRIHIRTPASVYPVCVAKLGAAALNAQRTCWVQSDSLTGLILRRLVHPFMALTLSVWMMCRLRPYVLQENKRHINPLQTKRRPLYLKTQSVPRCKHFSSQLLKPISLCCKWHKSQFVLR